MAVLAVVVLAVVLLGLVTLALRRRRTEVLTFPGPVDVVDIATPAGTIAVSGGVADVVTVRRSMVWLLRRPRATERLADGVLELRASGSPLGGGVVEYDVSVPSGTAVRARSTAGTVDVRGVAGGVDLEARAGSIRLADLPGGTATLRTSSGAILGRGLACPVVSATAASGSVDLELASPPDDVEAVSGTGAVHVRLPDGVAYAVEAQTGTGRTTVDVDVDSESPHRVRARASTGSVVVSRRRD